MSDASNPRDPISAQRRLLFEQRLRQKGLLGGQQHIARRSAPGPVALSFAQERLWFVDQLQTGAPNYNVPCAIHLAGALDRKALETSLQAVVDRHEALRTVFRIIDGQLVQVVAPAGHVPLTPVDLEQTPDRDEQLPRLLAEEVRRPFDLRNGPLIRARLFRLAPDEHVLALTMHHIVSDAWSLQVLLREIEQLYPSIAQGGPAALPDLPIQYADYALWQREQLRGETLERQLAHWRDRLAGAPALDLPTDFPRRPQPSSSGARHVFSVGRELVEAAQALGRRESASLFMTLLATFQILLQRYSGQDDLVVGTPVANRTRSEVEPLIGFFINMLALRVDLAQAACFRDALRVTRDAALDAYAHQDVPFEQIVEALGLPHDLGRHPLFQIAFMLQNATVQPPQLPGLQTRLLEVAYETLKFDLSLVFEETAAGLTGVFEYSRDLFAPETVARMAEHFCTLLAALVAQPDRPLLQHSLLTAEERAALADWSEGGPALPWRGSLPERLLAIAAQTPEATALRDAKGARSFAALLAQAQHLAAHLAARAPEPERPVAVLLERTGDLPAAFLAVWLAGRTLLPLDPTLPPARIAQLLDDAQPALLLASTELAASLPDDLPWPLCPLAELLHTPAPAPFAPAELGPDSPAYLIYTSGSTGTPKAVLASHGGLLAILDAASTLVGYQPGDVQPVMASAAFDIFLFELFAPLLSGATAQILSRDAVLALGQNPAPLAGWTVLHAVPSLLRVLLDALEANPEVARTLRHILVGGDRVPP
ncbi:MAG TPA: condensation domain-containing protein, partial [Roseiflexaceae bacterium]|nr:condensation domain-containing protein [Roseiflexaceae bacterium]